MNPLPPGLESIREVLFPVADSVRWYICLILDAGHPLIQDFLFFPFPFLFLSTRNAIQQVDRPREDLRQAHTFLACIKRSKNEPSFEKTFWGFFPVPLVPW